MSLPETTDTLLSIDSTTDHAEGYPFLCERAESFVKSRGIAEESGLVAYLFGASATPQLWRPLLRSVLRHSSQLEELHDGAWRCRTGAATSAIDSFVALDVETTGLGPIRNRIIEIGLIRYLNGEEVERYSSLCQPGRKLPAYISKLTGITDQDLVDAPQFADISDKVVEFIGADLVIGHNVGFDLAFVSAELKRVGSPPLINDSLDTMTLSMRLLSHVRRLSLDRLAEATGMRPRTLHRAVDDADLTARVLLVLLQRAAESGATDYHALRALADTPIRKTRHESARGHVLLDRTLLKGIPSTPGVYLMRDGTDRVIYVGKAKKLRERVRSYYSQPLGYTRKLDGLLELVQKIDHVETGSELNAFLLESQLIRWHQPRFNTAQRATEEYPYIRVDVANPWPRVSVSRARKDDGARYFGPYRSSKTGRVAVELLNDLFPLRTCKRSFKNARSYGSPCLRLDLQQCLAPCVGKADPAQYKMAIDAVIRFLEGDDASLLNEIQRQLEESAAALDFERSRQLRNNLRTLETVSAAERELRLAEQRHLVCLVSKGSGHDDRLLSLIVEGRLWANITISPGEPFAAIAERAERSFSRWQGSGHRPVDQDSLDGVIILGRWLNKIDGASFIRQFSAGEAPDWSEIAEWSVTLAESDLELIPEPRQEEVDSPVEAN